MADVIRYAQGDGLLDIVLGDPEGGNLVSNDEGDRLAATLAALGEEVKLVRLRSTGADFCLGRVSPMPKPGTPGVTAELIKRAVAEPAIRVYTALASAPVPVLGIVRGRAEGYGLGLLAAADVVLAGDGARFSIPEMQRQIPPTLVMTALLGRVPPKLVAHLVLSQEPIGAPDAFSLGLVSKVVPDGTLDEAMEALTRQILSYRSDSVRAIKEYLRFAEGRDRAAAGSFASNLAAAALSARFGTQGA
jgi:enoyl-CoA hydratase/carnithine racemase